VFRHLQRGTVRAPLGYILSLYNQNSPARSDDISPAELLAIVWQLIADWVFASVKGFPVSRPLTSTISSHIQPAFLPARKTKVESWHCAALGMLCSAPAIVAEARATIPPNVAAYSSANAEIVITWGAFSGFCFWLLDVAGDFPLTLRTILMASLLD
jgi:hypothetical protein